jgi:hypothetical protein
MEIDEAAALRSASWGASQILGDNFKAAGYENVQEMVNGFCDDEDDHIEAMINFVKASGIDDDLRRLASLKRPTTPDDCRIIARTYNGKEYEKNGYHTKMAAAHNKWRKIPDTPWSPESAAGPIIVAQGPVLGLTRDDIAGAQQMLKDRGYIEVGIVDGLAGKDTAIAVSAFQVVEGLPVTGKLTKDLIERIRISKMRPVSEARANATTKDVIKESAPAVASTVQSASFMKKVAMAGAGVFGLGGVFDGGIPDLDQLTSGISKTNVIIGLLGNKLPWLIGLAVAGVAAYYAHKIISRQIEGFRKGLVK